MAEIVERDDLLTSPEGEFELPRRPRRSLVSPLTVALSALLIGALGFIGGVQVQKRSAPASPAAGAFTGARGGGVARGDGGFTPGGGQATVGQVANVDGRTIYVTTAGGETIRVRTNKNSKVTRTAVSKAGAIHPGDSVVVQGSASSSGTVTASRITATASNASGGLAGLLGGGGGGFPGAGPGGGAAAGTG